MNKIKSYVLGETQTRPASSSDLLCAAQYMTHEDVQLVKEWILIELLRIAPTMTPKEIGELQTEIGKVMLPSAKREKS